jgi:ABC-type branched-subunit amino acid transport system substrate-binding protein
MSLSKKNRRSALTGLAVAAAVTLVVAGCSSTSKSSNASSSTNAASSAGAGGNGPRKTLTIGILTDVTGPAASADKTFVQGVEAGIGLAAAQGFHLRYVLGDTQTSPTGALIAAHALVDHDHVLVVLADSAVTYAAANYLTSKGVPVVGVAIDASEWITAKNMFSAIGAIHTNEVSTTVGSFFKLEGATSIAAIGYGAAPASSEAAKAAAASAQAAGLKVGYLNANLPFGSTNVQPLALAMKAAGIDAFTAEVDPNTGFALITALRNEGVDLKAALLPQGYGADLLQAGPGAIQEGQNVDFTLGYEPIEMRTAGTQQFTKYLQKVGVKGDPSDAEYNGYVSMALLIQGLQATGPNPTHPSLIAGLSTIHNFNAAGIYGSHTLDINDRTNVIGGVDNCEWVAKLSGTNFQLVPGAAPICGTPIPGKSVSSSS